VNIRFPKPLVPGDCIAITAPSSGVPAPMHPRLELAIAGLRQRGYRVVEGQCLRQQTKQASDSRERGASELMGFLQDPSIAAVMPPWGGERAIELLPLIDFQALCGIPPKWFVGFSDLSTLHLPLTTLSGWATLHGPNLMELGASELDTLTAAVWDVLDAPGDAQVCQAASKKFQRTGPDRIAQPGAGFLLTEDTQWKRLDGSSAPLQLSGRLIGGCLDTVARLAGTPYGNVPGFIKASASAGTLLYIENAEMKPCELARALWSLRLHAWFEGLNGILVGRNAATDATQAADLSYTDALQSAFVGLPCPVLYDLDIGHLPPQLSLVNGAWAQVSFQDGCGTVLQQLGNTNSARA
jgi:muramoyltetrapeptide carboxypeptidase